MIGCYVTREDSDQLSIHVVATSPIGGSVAPHYTASFKRGKKTGKSLAVIVINELIPYILTSHFMFITGF